MDFKKSPILVPNGVLRDFGDIIIHPVYGRPAVEAVMQVHMKDDYVKGVVRENLDRIQIIGRSGHSRAGLEVERKTDDLPAINKMGDAVEVPIILSSLRGANNDRLLTVLRDTFSETANGEPFEVGRLLIAKDEMALSREEIDAAKKSGQLYVSKQSEIGDDGVIQVPLEDMNFLFCEANFNRYRTNIREVLINGKHAFDGIQEEVKGLPANINAGEFFVGGIKIALGRYMAVIEKETNSPQVFHLAARILDGLRTTGVEEPRHVELYNFGNNPVMAHNLKVKIKLYPFPKTYQKINAGNPRRDQVKKGIGFSDIAGLEDNPDMIIHTLDSVSPAYSEDQDYALVLAGGRMAKSKWQDLPEFQKRNLEEVARRLVSGQSDDSIKGEAIDGNVAWLTKRLFDIGGNQKDGKVVISNAFPSPDVLEKLMKTGIAVYIARDLRLHDSAFPLLAKNGNENGKTCPEMDICFSSTEYEQFRAMERRGAKFYMVYPDIPDPQMPGGIVESHVRQFFRGFWVKPEAIEKMKKIDTIIAMYGTHIKGLDNALKSQLDPFLDRMKSRFDENVAITHGKGPGVMRIADNLAREKDMFRIGVGIDLEQQDQAGNYTPPAMVDFQSDDRLRRQKVMDDVATFKIFNIGGAGTLEEAAITLCSQKLHKSIITPIIFIDPIGDTEGEHMWGLLQEQIRTLALPYYVNETEHGVSFSFESSKQGEGEQKPKPVQLLKEHVPKYCHFVRSYEEAAEIIEKFVQNPMQYYNDCGIDPKLVKDAIENASVNMEKTGFSIPSWFDAQEIVKQCDNPELPL